MPVKGLHGRRPLGGVSVRAAECLGESVRSPGRGRKAAIAAIAVSLAACVSSPDVFTTYRERAAKDFRTPEAQAYVEALLPAVGADLAALLKRCVAEYPEDTSASFELVFNIDHWGEPKAILVGPKTAVSTCVASGFFLFSFPRPDARFEKSGLTMMLPIGLE